MSDPGTLVLFQNQSLSDSLGPKTNGTLQILHTFLQGLEKQGLPGPQRGQSHQFIAQADGLAPRAP